MDNQDNQKKQICFAPWIHSYLGPGGQRGLCCESAPFDESFQDFESYWNSDQLKRVRSMMLQGELPKEYCSVCLEGDMHSNLPLASYKVTPELKEQIFSETSEDGHYKGLPISLDYRGNNICNLSCRTCSPVYSSKIEAILEPEKKNSPFLDRLEEQKSLITEQTNKLYYANGEAFLQKSHWELLESIYNSGHAEHINLWYNTNLQFPLSLIEKHRDILSSFKKINLNISIDGAGETGEFIRDGLSWDKFKRNVEKIKKEAIFTVATFDITLTLPFLLDYKGFIDFLAGENTYAEVHMIVEGGFYQMLLSPYLVGPKELENLCREVIEYIDTKRSLSLIGIKKMLLSLCESAHKVDREKYSLERISKAIVLADEVDKKFNRIELSKFYRKFQVTAAIIEDSERLQALAQETIPIGSYWEQFDSEVNLFPSLEELNEKLNDRNLEKVERSFIVSDSTVLSRFLSKGEEKKFAAQSMIEEFMKKNTPKVKKERLGPFTFLFFQSRWRHLAQIVDFITIPFRGIIGFHCRYIILPRE